MLDPSNRREFRDAAHRMLDEALDDLESIERQPVWRAVPESVKHYFASDTVPIGETPLSDVYQAYRDYIAPYTVGNRHPRFFGWVHGNGTASGIVAQMLVGALNTNLGGREQAPVYVERAIVRWWAELCGFPADASGIVTSGTSIANLIAVLVARRRALSGDVRTHGIAGRRLVGYASSAVHNCVPKAFDVAGLGRDALRIVATDSDGRIDVERLQSAIAEDRANGCIPFMITATAGSVDTGAIDPLDRIADIAKAESLWMHVDGAFGAVAIIVPRLRDRLRGLERADSIALDFHKWLHVPYGAGLALVRDAAMHRATFTDDANYLARTTEGTAAGEPWFCDFGPELSRSFRALPVWFAMKEFGVEKFAAAIEMNCNAAQRLGTLLDALENYQLAAPVRLNIVCVRYVGRAVPGEVTLDAENAAIAIELQQSGVLVPSTTRIDGQVVLRFNFTNHRVREQDLLLVRDTLAAAALQRGGGASAAGSE